MKNSVREHCVAALLVGEIGSDRLFLHGVFRDAGWRLWEAPNRQRAMDCLTKRPVQVVISGTETSAWHWKGVLHDLRGLVHPPELIVTSRAADDYLWAEVLNMGGYDVLPQPFVRDEVEHVVAAARRQFERASVPVAAVGAA